MWLECPADHAEVAPGVSKKEAQRIRRVVISNIEIQEPYSAAPSIELRRLVEQDITPSPNALLPHQVFGASYSLAGTHVSPTHEPDAQSGFTRVAAYACRVEWIAMPLLLQRQSWFA